MATTLADLFDLAALEQAIEAGYVRFQTHPTLPYVIHNYSELAQIERHWTPVTTQCRGLVAHTVTGEVIARPWRKFHNAGEPGAYTPDPDEQVVVTEKLDGSLGIGVPTGDGGYMITTRGSFVSDQAQHATALWQTRYADRVIVPPGITPLWEIIYPANRIVVDNGTLDDLVLLGAVEIATGRTHTPAAAAGAIEWPGPVTETYAFAKPADVLAAPERANRAGYVLHFPATDERLKVKHEQYVKLHRIVTGMNERVVWEHLGLGKPLDELLTPLPDEFHAWTRSVADRLTGELEQVMGDAAAEHARIVAGLPAGWTRRDYAELAKRSTRAPWLFLLLDGRDPAPRIWRTLRPSGAITMTRDGAAA